MEMIKKRENVKRTGKKEIVPEGGRVNKNRMKVNASNGRTKKKRLL